MQVLSAVAIAGQVPSTVVRGEVRFEAEPILATTDRPVPEGLCTVTLDQLPRTTLDALFAAIELELNVPPEPTKVPLRVDGGAAGMRARLARFLPQMAIVWVLPLPADGWLALALGRRCPA